MAASFSCPTCGRAIPFSPADAGKRGRCPACGNAIQAPAVAAEARTGASSSQRLSSGAPSATTNEFSSAPTRITPSPLPSQKATTTRSSTSGTFSSPALAALVEEARADPARRLGPFVLLAELGKGGMGVVHRAWDDRLSRVVALKTILPGVELDAATVQRFHREAEAAARLRHQNIVSVLEKGELQGRHYIAMDYVEGSSLDERLSPKRGEKRIALTSALEVVRDVARAVHYAHEQGVVHRDLKPANILLDAQERPYVLDFGLASVRGGSGAKLTRTGMAFGTPAYMPPEQASGEATDERSDVYALGATLYHVLAGHPPFHGTSDVNLIVSVLTKDPRPPRSLNPRIAGDLETICMKCLEKEPARRYAKASEVADELDRYLAGEAIAARPLGPAARLLRRARRNKLKAALVVLLVLLAASLASGAALVEWTNVRNERENAALAERAVAAEREKVREAARAEARASSSAFSKLLAAKPVAGAGAEAERRRQDDVLASGLRALQSAMRLQALAPEERAAREAAFQTALAFGKAALDAAQWSVAASAFEEARGLGVDEARARSELAQVDARRRAAFEEHEKTLEATIAAALARTNAYDHEDALFALVRLAEPETAKRLAKELDESTRLLGEARRSVLLAAAEPSPDEARAGARPIEGLAAALDAVSTLPPGERAEAAALAAIDQAGKRVVEREVRRRPVGLEAPKIEALIAGAQLERLGPGRVELTRLACEALGRIGIRDAALAALLRYLYAETDAARAIPAGVAIARLGDAASSNLARSSPHGKDRRFEAELDRALGRSGTKDTAKDAKSYGELFERALARVRRGEIDGAIADFRAAIELDPDASETHANLGVALGMKGDLDGAIRELGRAVELAPGKADNWQNRAIARAKKGDLEGAISDFGRAIELDPRSPGNYMNRGSSRASAHDWEGAANDLTRAIELDATLGMAWRNRGQVRIEQGKLDEALSDLTRAIELDARDAEALVARGRARLKKKDALGGMEDLGRAIDAAPRLVSAWHERGHARLDRGDLDGAIADFTRAIELDPKDGHYYRDRGSSRQRKGDVEGAIADLTRAVELVPDLAVSWSERASARRDSGDFKGAVDDATRAIELAPGNFNGWLERGLARSRLGETEGALADMTRATEVGPKNPATWTNRADARRDMGDLAGAIADASRAIEVSPQYFGGWMVRGRARSETGEHAAAIADLTRAIELDPHVAFCFAFRGNAKMASGDLPGAIADYTRSLELDPRDGWTWLNRSLAHEKANDAKAAIADLEKVLEVTTKPQVVAKAKEALARLRGK